MVEQVWIADGSDWTFTTREEAVVYEFALRLLTALDAMGIRHKFIREPNRLTPIISDLTNEGVEFTKVVEMALTIDKERNDP